MALMVALQLSTECRDLLDRIFMVDEKNRISIQDIKRHEWYNKRLGPRHQHAELDLLEQQSTLEAHMATRELDQVRYKSFHLARQIK